METVLGIVVTNYPYGFGEPFLQDEVEELSKQFDRILIIIPINKKKINFEEQLFDLPSNVFVLPIYNKYHLLHKIGAFIRIGPFSVFKRIKLSVTKFNLPISWELIKVFMSYVAKEFGFRRNLVKELKKQNFDINNLVLYTYWFTEYTYALYKLKRKYPALHVYSRAHGWDVYFERHTPAYLPFRSVIIPALDATFTVSDHARNYLIDKLVLEKPEAIKTSRLGVKGFSMNSFEIQPGCINLLSVAFISPVKNLELLIDSLVEIGETLQINWYHIGDGDVYANEIKDLAKAKLGKRSNVSYSFLGNLTHIEIDNFLKQQPIDLFLNTSHYEGIPVSMMEALSSGIPIAGPCVGGIPEIVADDKNGFLFSEKPTSKEIAMRLIDYSNMTKDQILVLRTNAYNTWKADFNAEINFKEFGKRLLKGLGGDFKACSRCILDTQDYPEIVFDENGVCNICHTYDEHYRANVLAGEKGEAALNKLLIEIKSKGKNKQYDCLIGVSGGVDSTYLAYLCKEWGLRPLVLHVDNGWDSEIAVKNIENIINKLGFDLYTEVINWSEMKSLQLAFLKASVVDTDVPTDNTYIASIYKIARKFKIKYVLTGHNTVTEGWLPPNFNHFKYDLANIHDIHNKFGTAKIKSIPLIGIIGLWVQKNIYGIQTYSPLNYISYNKVKVKNFIKNELEWRDYGAKHYENIFTRFYQGFILPEKFKVNKRKAHLSTLICSGQLSRDQALIENSEPLYNETQYREDREYFIKKMDLTEHEFVEIMQKPPVPHTYYKSYLNTITWLRPFGRLLRKLGIRK